MLASAFFHQGRRALPARRGEVNPDRPHKQNRSRGALMRPSFVHDDHAKIDSLPAIKEGSGAPKGACHPCPRKKRGCALLLKRRAAFRRSRLRHSPPATTPMAQPQNRVSRRRTLLSVLPAWPDCLRLSTLRADRSFCRSTGDPEPPGSGWHIRARAPPLASVLQACPSGKAPSMSEVVSM